MTDLWHSLLKTEYTYLKIIAEKWDFAFTAPDTKEGIDLVTDVLLSGKVLADIAEILNPTEHEALVWLDDQGGKAPWDHITRRYGQVRDMGEGRLERERPDLDPVSPLESLWYRALIARGFFETETGPQEFGYLPDDLREIIMPLINPHRSSTQEIDFICRVAAPREKEEILPKPDFILDQICTLLAGIRIGLDPAPHIPGLTEPEEDFIRGLAASIGLLDDRGEISPDAIRDFLDLNDSAGLKSLWDSWLDKKMAAELYMLPDIQVEGDPPLESSPIRKQVLTYLGGLPAEEWWSIESFLSQVKDRQPDILRAGGEYDAWFIKRKISEEYLTGFEYWDEIEGALLRFFITGPLLWLGLTELAAPEEDSPPLAFQLTPLFYELMAGRSPSLKTVEPDPIQLRSQGEIRITTAVPRKTRYQIARFCDWYPVKAEAYQYRLSPGSLIRAEGQGLRVPHLLSLLKNHVETIPPNILTALERWDKSGSQAAIEPRTVLRLGSPAILKALKKSRASRYILEQIGPTVVTIQPGSEEKISQALMELGFFVQVEDQAGSQT